MFGELSKLWRAFDELRQEVKLIRSGLVRMGSVHSVDSAAGTVIVQYLGNDATDQPSRSHAMPWLQRATEHRPPDVGDHAIVLDMSLGRGSAVAITGWPSTAKPAAGGGGVKHVVVSAHGGAIEVDDAGTVTINGVTIDTSGNVAAPGDVESAGAIAADGEVTAKAAVPAASVKLSTHLHPHPMGPTSAPTAGT